MTPYTIGNFSHKGMVRKANEDYFESFDSPCGQVVVVCDGMGGHVGGAKASRTAVAAIRKHLTETDYADPRQALYNALIQANEAVITYGQTHPELKGLGSTCVILLVRDNQVYYAHVGDSRIYLFSHQTLTQITEDHSYVQLLVNAGEITAEEAEHHPRKNEITNALGLENMKPPTVATNPIAPQQGDCFLLCSDGLSGMVSDNEIQATLENDRLSVQEKAEHLVDLANAAGGVDNITVQLVAFGASAKASPSPRKTMVFTRRHLYILLAVLAALLLGALCYCYFATDLFPRPNARKEAPAPPLPPVDSTAIDSLVHTHFSN